MHQMILWLKEEKDRYEEKCEQYEEDIRVYGRTEKYKVLKKDETYINQMCR